MAKQDDFVRYTIRVPAPLYEWLKQAAGMKSVNAEIVDRLKSSLGGWTAESLKVMEANQKAIFESLARIENGLAQLGVAKPKNRKGMHVLVKASDLAAVEEDQGVTDTLAGLHPETRIIVEIDMDSLATGPKAPAAMTEDQMIASADMVRSRAGDAADVAMVGMDATKEQKATRRRELTDEPAVVGKARGKGK